MVTWMMAATLLLAAPALKELRKPVKAPVGRWAVERLERNGTVLVKATDENKFLHFTEKSFGLELYGLDPTMTNADFYEVNGQSAMEYWPVGKDHPVMAIWKLDGESLVICEGYPGAKRPTDFTADKGSRRALWVLKRLDK
jgi:hypothetical protein